MCWSRQTVFCFLVLEDPAKGSQQDTNKGKEVFSYKQSENNTENNKVRAMCDRAPIKIFCTSLIGKHVAPGLEPYEQEHKVKKKKKKKNRYFQRDSSKQWLKGCRE